jgi:2-polyprenyl-3-methyl-5-hydroxy-6-metoxy-1,4-benzoquinol methylase
MAASTVESLSSEKLPFTAKLTGAFFHMYTPLNSNSLYTNQGNLAVLKFLNDWDRHILDIGCGAGDLGKLIRSVYPSVQITGITCSQKEYEQAVQKLDHCICTDIERGTLPEFKNEEFDAIIFSHILEHLVNPLASIQRILPYLKRGGKVIIALPNIANWRDRWKLALGRFEYTDGGIMDKTHLHFYTFYTAPHYLIEPIPQLKLEHHSATGSIPLGFLRHHFLSQSSRKKLDSWGCSWKPNLFGYEILIKAVKQS